MRRRLAAAITALTVALGVGIGTPASQAIEIDRAASLDQADSDRPLRHVHMGDSYAAASGVLPLDPTAPLQCLRSSANFGQVMAEAIGARLTDVSCGGAQTKDYFKPQYDGVPPQLDALRKRTQLVTMTIGGNNNDTFISAIVSCGTAGATTGYQGSPCKNRYGRSFAKDIRNKTKPALIRTLRAVHKRAPRAEVAILGYPWILPESGGCPDKMPVAEGDVPYLRGIQALLNRVVKRAAKVTGSTYVNLNRFSDGHDACQPIGVRWVEPVLQSTNPVVVHPNALGESKMAAKATRVLGLD